MAIPIRPLIWVWESILWSYCEEEHIFVDIHDPSVFILLYDDLFWNNTILHCIDQRTFSVSYIS